MRINGYILPVLAGVVAGMLFIFFGELLLHQYFPFPGGQESNAQPLAAAIRQAPDSAFQLLLLNYALASLIAGLVATLVVKRTKMLPAVVVGVVLTLSAIFNVITLPHPLWFAIANLMVYLPFAYFGYLAVRKRGMQAA